MPAVPSLQPQLSRWLSPFHGLVRRAKDKADYLAVGTALAVCHSLSIHVHGGLDGGMTHQFLLHFHRSPGFVQPRAVRVAERVPADVIADSGSNSRRLQDALLK